MVLLYFIFTDSKFYFVITDTLMIWDELTVTLRGQSCLFKKYCFEEICVDRLMTGVLRDKIVKKYLYLTDLPRLNQQSSYYRKMHFKDISNSSLVNFYFSLNRKSRWFSRTKRNDILHIIYDISDGSKILTSQSDVVSQWNFH